MRLLSSLAAAAIASLAIAGLAVAAPLPLVITKAELEPYLQEWTLKLVLAPESRGAFADFTKANVGRIIDLRIDGDVVFSATLREPILRGEVMVSGGFARSELQPIAERILSGTAKVTADVKAE